MSLMDRARVRAAQKAQVVDVKDATFEQVLDVLRRSTVYAAEDYTRFGASIPTDEELVADAWRMCREHRVEIYHTAGFPADNQGLLLHPR